MTLQKNWKPVGILSESQLNSDLFWKFNYCYQSVRSRSVCSFVSWLQAEVNSLTTLTICRWRATQTPCPGPAAHHRVNRQRKTVERHNAGYKRDGLKGLGPAKYQVTRTLWCYYHSQYSPSVTENRHYHHCHYTSSVRGYHHQNRHCVILIVVEQGLHDLLAVQAHLSETKEKPNPLNCHHLT
jgi:hypothetical protein